MMLKTIVYFTFTLLIIGSACFSAFGHGDLPILLEDVNQDGIVNIQDLVLVAAAFGQARDGTDALDADVNRDSVVNVLDLVRVSKSFGQTAPDENSAFHNIQANIFDRKCASSTCHAEPANMGNLNLTYGTSYANLIGRQPSNPSAAAAGMKLIDPGNPENSFLLTKLMEISAPTYGARMPIVGELHTGKIDAIRRWILAGAPQTGKVVDIGDLGVLRDPDEVFHPPAPPPIGEGYQLYLPPFKIEPNTEREVFYATQIRDENGDLIEEDIFINRYEIFYPSGSHHFILYRLTEAAVSAGILHAGRVPGIGVNPEDVFRELNPDNPQALGNIGTHRFFVAGTQSKETKFAFPEGVAMRLKGDTLFDLNAHFINLLGDEILLGEVYVNLYTILPENVEHEALELFINNQSINVPPGMRRVTKLDWLIKGNLQQQDIDPGAGLQVMMLTSHMHRHGELFEITKRSTGELLHRSLSYDAAPITFFTPPLFIDANDALSFACTHNNYDRNVPIEFGFTSEDEMCIVVGYYYVPVNDVANDN